MERQHSEARDAFIIGAAFLGYAALLYLVARRQAQGTATAPGTFARFLDWLQKPGSVPLDLNRLEFQRTRRDAMIAEENANGD